MENLETKTCTPCQGGIPPLPEDEARRLLEQAPGWNLEENGTRLRRRWKLADYGEAFELVRKISELAEAEGHHPEISFGWGYCEVVFYTHKIGGLHENDFIIAAKVSKLD